MDLRIRDSALADVAAGRETLWLNDRLLPFDMVEGLSGLVVSEADITDEVMASAVHICWATGGRLVPEAVWQEYLAKHLPCEG